jgi:hypothetical protein
MSRFHILLPVITFMVASVGQAVDWDRTPGVTLDSNRACNIISPSQPQCTYDFTDATDPAYNLRVHQQCRAFIWLDPDISGAQDTARVDVARCESGTQAYGSCTEIAAATKAVRAAPVGTNIGIQIDTAPVAVTARLYAQCEADANPRTMCNVSIEDATATDDIMCGQAETDLQLQELRCVFTGTPTAHIMRVYECNTAGASCAWVGDLTVTGGAAGEQVDNTTSAVIDAGNWWMIGTESLTAAADWVHCEVPYLN